jgi:hypothetical protein
VFELEEEINKGVDNCGKSRNRGELRIYRVAELRMVVDSDGELAGREREDILTIF